VSGTFTLQPAGPGRLAASGTLDFDTAVAALDRGLALMRDGTDWQIDLSGVAAADSAGLAVLLEWLKQARAAGRGLVYLDLPAQLRAIAQISDIEELLTLAPGGPGGVAATRSAAV